MVQNFAWLCLKFVQMWTTFAKSARQLHWKIFSANNKIIAQYYIYLNDVVLKRCQTARLRIKHKIKGDFLTSIGFCRGQCTNSVLRRRTWLCHWRLAIFLTCIVCAIFNLCAYLVCALNTASRLLMNYFAFLRLAMIHMKHFADWFHESIRRDSRCI